VVKILHLKRAAGEGVKVQTAGVRDRGFADFVPIPIRIRLRGDFHRQALLVAHGILVPINRGIYAQAESVLMILRQRTRTNHIPPIGRFSRVDVHDGDDAGGAGFDADPARLVEFEGEDVFVVCEGDDVLDHELAAAGYYRAAGAPADRKTTRLADVLDKVGLYAPVGVFPVNTVILLVNTNNIRRLLRRAIRTHDDAVEVLDHAEAVAAELQVVAAVAQAAVAEVEGLFAVERGAGVGVGDGLQLISIAKLVCGWRRYSYHLAESEPVKDAAAVVVDVVDDCAFAGIEGDAEAPFLPFDESVVCDCEARPVGLRHI